MKREMMGAITVILLMTMLGGAANAATASRSHFGTAHDGTKVDVVSLSNKQGMTARVIAYGARLQSLLVPDRNGHLDDVVLGYDDLASYEADHYHFGGSVGRFASRIAGAAFSLDGARYRLSANDGANHLHGGMHGLDARIWTIVSVTSGPESRVVLKYVSPAGEEGYPGKLTVHATYALDERSELTVEYRATTDRPTIVNVTQHSYFNLAKAGDPAGALGQSLTIAAARFTPSDATAIPTGAFASVKGTPFDFRQPRAIDARVRDGRDSQLVQAHGYDENYVIDGPPGTLRRAARLVDTASGRAMDLLITAPGLQFYSGNYLMGAASGKGGLNYRQGDGVCLEPQVFPDAPNKKGFPSARLNPGELYKSRIVFRFSVVGT